MYPTICKIGPLSVYSYGLMLAIAVVVCSFLMAREAKGKGVASDLVYDLVFVTIIGGIIGARIFHVFLFFSYFKAYPQEIIMIQKGGLAWQGALIFGFLSCVWFLKRKNLSVFKMLDLFAPYVALGQAIGRVGCFLNGCCYGRAVWWGIYFPVHDAYLHPTQLYLTAGYLTIFIFLRGYHKKDVPAGFLTALYILSASMLRFIVEFFRADHVNTLFGLSIYQFICLVLILCSLMSFKKINKNNL